ncbi:hypothetical protein ATO6_00435 [Oceanicola sp. 22II-s10i]|uniref:hypothetical protein n=1 Tax=Oceanicola sp. 22II-s10i TaxID=1317116 RepID=UPI000B522555|nr:hypothetical protein [Oceanicola sp. 22II-s10i]OWU85458.1 hypothetical protein ATO6_00435 [Oceanicola sp. 22II-s10i]
MTTTSIYSDLFDDGITGFNFVAEDLNDRPFELRLLHAIRFQVLLAILFERQIAVPEAWMTSSPLFVTVFTEVFAARPSEVFRREPGSTSPRFAHYPFRPVFSRPKHGNAADNLLASLIWRLETGRRIQWLPELPGATEAEQQRIRRELTGLLGAQIGPGARTPGFALDLSGAITDLYGLPQDRADGMALSVCRVLDGLNQPVAARGVSAWGPDGEATYRSVMESRVDLVRQAVFESPALIEAHPDETKAFQAFFNRAEAQGLLRNDVMGMWQVIQREAREDVRATVEAFGRFAMNSGYAASGNSQQAAHAFSYYSGGKSSDFTQALLSEAVARITRSDEATIADAFVEIAPTPYYDLADTLDWDRVWAEAFEIAQDYRWRRERQAIELQIGLAFHRGETGFDHWMALFDRINGGFQDVMFDIRGGDRPAVAILARNREKSSTGDKAGSALGKIGIGALSTVTQAVSTKTMSAERALQILRNLRWLGDRDGGSASDQDIVISKY